MHRLALHRFWLLALLCIGTTGLLQAQSSSLTKEKETALRFLQANPVQFNLEAQDVADVRITDAYVSRHNGVTHVWVQQQHKGIPVYNALFGLHVKPDGSVLHLGHRFVPQLSQRVNTVLPSLGAARALELCMAHLGFTGFPTPAVERKIDARNWVFKGGAISRAEIPVKICYQLDETGAPRLAWNVYIDQANSSDLWTICVDAQTGQILSQHNHTVYCKAGHAHLVGETCQDEVAPVDLSITKQKTVVAGGAADETYNVFPFPAESPIHGGRQLLVNPHDAFASPFGWLDTDGVDGADYTYTRGNNVWAFEDSANDNTPSPDESADGGADLNFDFPFDPDAEPDANLEAAVTNLFYANNMMHDIAYRYGFDEQSGNFQTNNYGNGGEGGDAVLAQAIDGSGENNANFATPSDGGPGRMQMYRWSGQSGNIITVNGPGAILGTYYARVANGWGGNVTSTPITGDVVITDDGTGSGDETKNCNPPVNDLQGKIAMVDRGICQFGQKALTAQQAGAVACIICNYEDGTIAMGGGNVGGQVTIPAVMMTKTDCDILRQYAGAGLNISLVEPTIAGPDFLDADFDNGIIAHEFGHGISNRLTGGPSSSGCLGNDEQMGEGWSDFFTLVTTVQSGDIGEKKRGIGTYVLRQSIDGQGIRRYPYSTDMSISPVTFATVAANTQVHALGEVWAAVTWDLYWAMVEKYGYDADITNANSGNARAIQLVMDGMKLQPCGPGFLDGRDAIMNADILNYDGVDTCLISEVFARRGMGVYASQGSPNDAGDGVENFDPIPECVKELKITKVTTTPLIFSGDNAEFTITITNHKDEAVTNVVVTDPLPAGLTFVSASNGGTDDNGVVTWDLGTIASGAVMEITYTAKSDAGKRSERFFQDDMETDGDSWIALVNNNTGSSTFYLQGDNVQVGSQAWRADAPVTETDQVLLHYLPIPITGDVPVMRFWHQFNTQAGTDAGFLEVQIDGETQWRRLDPAKGFRNGYSGSVGYGTLAIPFLSGFSGNSNGWMQSYFDLSDFKGQNIVFQFRFGTDEAGTVADAAWIVDRVEMMDMLNYESVACVTSAEGDQACDRAPARGVIIDPDSVLDTDQPDVNALGMEVRPNPATDVVTLTFGEAAPGPVQVLLFSADGRLVSQQNTENIQAGQMFSLDVQQLPAGMYVLRVESSKGSSVTKVTKR